MRVVCSVFWNVGLWMSGDDVEERLSQPTRGDQKIFISY